MRCVRTHQPLRGSGLGRPRRDVPNRPTSCPLGHRGAVILWGTRAWGSAPYRRQRFRCRPLDGSRPHTFSMNRRRAREEHPDGEACLVCDIAPGAAQGPLSRVDHLHTGLELAHLLALVASGTSLREASQTVRREAQRFVRDPDGLPHASREHALAARYLDLFGAAIEARLAPLGCPRILVLDSGPFGLRGDEGERGGAVFAAVGTDEPGRTLVPWRLDFAPDETAASWSDFLAALDGGGPGPEWVVADGATAIRLAVAARWPDAQFYSCEYHLRGTLLAAAQRDGIGSADPACAALFEQALWSTGAWDALGDCIIERAAHNLADWYLDNDALVREQIELRRRFPGHQRSNAAAEGVLRWVSGCFDRRRRNGLRNAKRLHLVLALMRAQRAGQAHLSGLAAIVKPVLRDLPRDVHFAWTALHDRRDEPCSITLAMRAAHERARAALTASLTAARHRSLLAATAAANVELAAAGLPPLLAEARPGRRVGSVSVRGKDLKHDFPLVARDWDTAANERPIAGLAAGSDYRAHWRCHRCDHRWVAPVLGRTSRQTRCPHCATGRATAATSFAALHPELVAELDPNANGDLRPDALRATSRRRVVWRCPAQADHPPYRMSLGARARVLVGCPVCRGQRPSRGEQRADSAA